MQPPLQLAPGVAASLAGFVGGRADRAKPPIHERTHGAQVYSSGGRLPNVYLHAEPTTRGETRQISPHDLIQRGPHMSQACPNQRLDYETTCSCKGQTVSSRIVRTRRHIHTPIASGSHDGLDRRRPQTLIAPQQNVVGRAPSPLPASARGLRDPPRPFGTASTTGSGRRTSPSRSRCCQCTACRRTDPTG